MSLWLGLSMAFVIGLVHFFGEEIDEYFSSDSLFIVSFSAGFTIAYFFLEMLPLIAESGLRYEFFFVLAGFSLFFVLEELIYESSDHFSQIKKEFKELHTAFITIYHACIGIILYFLLQQDFSQGVLFFTPVLVHTAVNSLAIKEMNEQLLDSTLVKASASFSSVLGILIYHFTDLSQGIVFVLYSLIGGMFVYLVVHDSLDPRKERPIGFITGVLIFLLFSLL